MKDFIKKHSDKILGVISGFDRLIFKGCVRQLMYESGMSYYLSSHGILLKNFKDHALHYSSQLKNQTQKYAADNQRPFIYLPGSHGSKEKMAQKIAEKDNIKEGLICVFSTMESCRSYKVVGNRAIQKLQIKSYPTKCLHFYHYWIDPRFGLMHGRIQSWYPFNIQFYLNGKEWLKNQMNKENISFDKADNCFTWVSDFEKANELSKMQLQQDWQKIFNPLTKKIVPIYSEIFSKNISYYWTLAQSEWATDFLFKDSKSLEIYYPYLLHHSMVTFKSKDIMRFLGRHLTSLQQIHKGFHGEVISNIKVRPEGARIKHSINSNSVKLYNKAGSVLRAEATINNPSEFKIYRYNYNSEIMQWQPMRKSIQDIPKRAEISQKIVNRQMDALSYANVGDKFPALLEPVIYSTQKGKIKVRGLDPFVKDKALLDVVIRGEFRINGFRNRDIRGDLFPSINQEESKKYSAKVSRMLRLLRMHGVIRKIPKTHRYMITEKGIQLISALKTIQNTNTNELLKIAA